MNSKGAALLYAIASILILAAFGSATYSIISSSVGTSLETNRSDEANYAARSGINYARAQTGANLDALITAGAKNFTLTNGVTFRLTVGAKNAGTGMYPVTVLGTANPGTAIVSNAYLTANVTPAPSGGADPAGGKGLSGKSAKVAGYVGGNVLAETVSLQGGSTVAGSVTSTSTTAALIVSGGVTVGGGGASLCSNANVTVSGGSQVVTGDIYAQGDVLIDGGATVNGNIYAKGSVTIDGGATVNGNIHSLSTVNFQNGRMGTSSTKRYIYADGTVTATGGSNVYVDIHSQDAIDLQNVTVNGNMYAKNGVATTQWQTHLYGSIFTAPTAPTPPAACAANTPPTAPVFTAGSPININSSKTFTAGNYYYTTFDTAWTDICFDVSGGDINIFVSGNASSNATLYIKTNVSGSCYSNSTKMNNIGETFSDAASKIFLYTGGTFTLGGGVDWFGTVLASGSINPGGGSSIIGSLQSINGAINPNGAWYEIKYVESDYLNSH